MQAIATATVGDIKPGCLRTGNTGGMLDNLKVSHLDRTGSVTYVSRSGGRSNEWNDSICRSPDSVCKGVAMAGDRYPGSRFLGHFLRHQDHSNAKMLLRLGKLNRMDEYDLFEAVQSGRITKPIIAWCVCTCASHFATLVQFAMQGPRRRAVWRLLRKE